MKGSLLTATMGFGSTKSARAKPSMDWIRRKWHDKPIIYEVAANLCNAGDHHVVVDRCAHNTGAANRDVIQASQVPGFPTGGLWLVK